MRQHGSDAQALSAPFPWRLAVFDAHCHPTDTMGSIASLATMRASALAIMATRSQDQDLVAHVASVHAAAGDGPFRPPSSQGDGDDDGAAAAARGACRAIPSFGWHPWFSHQLYDDVSPAPATYMAPPPPPPSAPDEPDNAGLLAAKRAHYQAVLAPAPQDDGFIALLPAPVPLSSFVSSTRARLAAHPHALVGEAGLDKAFRIPENWDPALAAARDQGLTPGGREGRLLSRHTVKLQHQQAVLRAQLRLAGQAGRPVSLHCVQAHGALYETLASLWKGYENHVPSRRERRNVAPGAEPYDSDSDSHSHSHSHSHSDPDPDSDDCSDGREPTGSTAGQKPFPPRICLHSYSGSVESLRQWLHPKVPATVFFSFSIAVNLGTQAARSRFAQVVDAVPGDRILVESDLHAAGEDMDAALEHMYRQVCRVKGWGLEEGVKRIGENFQTFVFGDAQKR
ncbi:uncharacterized protein UV8b_00902 [Ustilaginoidea virens]|uniref:Cut9 interacting protein Scn1 n=1 Tax=Ustilaginoidea virens TaxID=1159556 RepID=A0A8E5HJL8_USTVR|nr:uncharacterized protein UV8b_00902 [Ustilaginoidea virens]QUC16661.1 hypothetical protein UV8b_00902 [Ustilaginoidea virens]